MEQRLDPRLPVDLHAVIVCPQFGLFRGEIENASTSGVFIRTRNVNICVNAKITMTLQEGDQPDALYEAEGVVVHQNRKGFGVRLLRADEHCRRLLERILQDTEQTLLAGPLAI